jgi:hypothetical protein
MGTVAPSHTIVFTMDHIFHRYDERLRQFGRNLGYDAINVQAILTEVLACFETVDCVCEQLEMYLDMIDYNSGFINTGNLTDEQEALRDHHVTAMRFVIRNLVGDTIEAFNQYGMFGERPITFGQYRLVSFINNELVLTAEQSGLR